jgi:hypothetical protein
MIKKQIFPVLLGSLMLLIALSACTDERTRPDVPIEPSYNETQFLLDKAISNGEDVTATFNLRDGLADGRLFVYCFIDPDEDMDQLDELTEEIGTLESEIDEISANIFELWATGNLSFDDSMALISERDGKNAEITNIRLVQDTLDTWLDDKYKLSINLDDDVSVHYPNSVRIDLAKLNYPNASTIVWGQGNYLALDDADGIRGRRIEIDLNEFWVADPSWEHPVKPLREEFLLEPPGYPDRYTAYELMPIRTWLDRFTPGTEHTLHFNLGSDGTNTKISASLFLVYNNVE